MSTSFFQFYSLTQLPDFHMIATIAKKKKSSAIAAIIWKPLSSDRIDNDHWDRTFYISAIVVAAIATRQWKVVSLWSRRSLKFFSSAIAVMTAIVAIIWKPDLSYASLLNKIRFNNCNIILIKQEGCIMLFTYSCFNCRNEKGLLNFVSEGIKLVYRINNTGYNVRKK